MSDIAQLLIPPIRWHPAHGFGSERSRIDRALAAGVGGFILYGGGQDAVRALTKELRQRSRVPLLIAADMERGAGQQFTGATGLPPLAAIAALDDLEAIRKAARLTAREARTLGVNWDLAPVCDLDLIPDNPMIGTRALGADPARVAALAGEWITACQSEGVLACAKHFPGHGRTVGDTHHELPTVTASRRELLENDLIPFRAAIDAGVAAMMTGHVAYPALDPSGAPAAVSREILRWFLRQTLRYEGLVVAYPPVTSGALQGYGEGDAAVRALDAGCDVLLHPEDFDGVARRLEDALDAGELDPERIGQSLRRRLKWAQWASPPNEYRRPSLTDVAWGAQLADRVVRLVRGAPPELERSLQVTTVDDDVHSDGTLPSRQTFLAALGAGGVQVRPVGEPVPRSGESVVIALFGDGHARNGHPGYSRTTCAAVAHACSAAPEAVVMQFGHPRLALALPEARVVVSAWGGDPVMQQAAARWLLGVMAR